MPPHKVLGVPLVPDLSGPCRVCWSPLPADIGPQASRLLPSSVPISPSSTFGRFVLSPVLCSSKNRMASLFPITMVHLEGIRNHLRI